MKKLFLLFSVFVLGYASAQNSLLESYISQPVHSSLAVSEDGKQLAWVIYDRGKRNIMHKDPAGHVKQITGYTLDDGQDISSLCFTEDGNKLIYVKGGGTNRAGEHPNPMSYTSSVEQEIWLINLTNTDEHYKLCNGSNPVIWKGKDKILYSDNGQIFQVSLLGDPLPGPLFKARGTNGDVTISPDSKSVAFSSSRGDHAFIGMYTEGADVIKWISPETSRDDLPSWSPDGKQIAFIRTPGSKFDELNNFTGGVRFSVMVADVATGKAKAVWSSPADDGGFAQSYPSTPLKWTKTNRILFTSEHLGWLHIYSMNPDGSDLKEITPGDCESENFTLDKEEKNVYYDCNCNDIDRRHIWRTGVSETASTQITSGEGIEMFPAIADNELYYFQSTYSHPKILVRYDQKKKSFEPLIAPVESGSKFIKPEQVILTAPDGLRIHAQLFIDRSKPDIKSGGDNMKGRDNMTGQDNKTGLDITPGLDKMSKLDKMPGIVFMHGGPIREMLLGFHYSSYYINCYAFNQYLASQGYAVISVNFRAGTGYGREFRRTKDQGPRGASEYQDVVAAAKYLQSLPEVNPEKIGLWGGSYGGYLTAMGLARNPEIFKAGVDLHGVHDWVQRARLFSPGGGRGLTEADYDLAYTSSPVADLSKWTSPVLLVHGDDDRNVLFQQTTDLAERLRERNVTVEILTFPDEIHGFLRYESWKQVFERAKDFFDRYLKN